MTFSSEALHLTLQSSFSQGGAEEFREFVGENLTTRQWIIASDYNIGAPGATHDVYVFACYPISHFRDLKSKLEKVFFVDFKKTSKVSNKQAKFFKSGLCYCFVFFVPRPRTILRTKSSHSENLTQVRSQILDSLRKLNDLHAPSQMDSLRSLVEESNKKNFSIEKFENILLLATFHGFISGVITSWMSVDDIIWFPDRDDMTTYCGSLWSGISFITWEAIWRTFSRNAKIPRTLVIDHRVKNLQGIYDPLIRVPDFMAATLSRWNMDLDPKRVALTPPDGSKPKAMRRYLQLLISWMPENRALWMGRIRFDDQGTPKVSRMIASKTPNLDQIRNHKY